MDHDTGPEPEDSFAFTSTILGALSQTLAQQSSPKTILLGLVLASVAKAVPSLGNPHKRTKREEDWVLLFAALLGALVGGVWSSFTYADPVSQEIVTVGLVIALAGKTISSLKNRSLEDEVGFALAIASLAFLPLGVQYAWTGVFFGYLAKELLSSGPTQNRKSLVPNLVENGTQEQIPSKPATIDFQSHVSDTSGLSSAHSAEWEHAYLRE